MLLIFFDRISANITHSQELKTLAIQINHVAFSFSNHFANKNVKLLIDRRRNVAFVAFRLRKTNRNLFFLSVVKSKMSLRFATNVDLNTKHRNVRWINHIVLDFERQLIFLDSMRVKFAIAKMMFSIFVNIIVSSLHQRDTKAYIRNVKASLMFTNQCFSQRSLNKKRRLTSIIQSSVDRERSKKSNEIDESIDSRVEIVVDSSLFLFQNEKSSQFEQHDNYDDFDSDIEIERFVFEFSNVVFIIEKTKVSKSQLSKIDRDRFLKSRSRVVERFLSSFWYYLQKKKINVRMRRKNDFIWNCK